MPTFASQAPTDGMYYSWDAGCIHFVALNSESPLDTPQITTDQVQWLQDDLEAYSARKAAGQAAREADPAMCSYDAPSFAVVYMQSVRRTRGGGGEDS